MGEEIRLLVALCLKIFCHTGDWIDQNNQWLSLLIKFQDSFDVFDAMVRRIDKVYFCCNVNPGALQVTIYLKSLEFQDLCQKI